MDEVITFTITVSTRYVGSKDEETIEIDREDLQDVPEDDWDDYVWDHLGGKEVAHELVNMDISHGDE